MSTFLGLIEEIPGISVDRFDEANLQSSAFFLSHCHTDHMIGLRKEFFQELHQSKRYLYCSPISKLILKDWFDLQESDCIKEILIDIPNFITYKMSDENHFESINVTCVSAGHCPGSVMFLFEKDGKSILYTGDFRRDPIDFPRMKSLHYSDGIRRYPRMFDKIYLDTTFLSSDFSHLPTRKESMLKLCEVAKSWLDQHPRNVVILECSALYGSEYLFMELSKSLNAKIHVKDKVYRNYQYIAELSNCITSNSQSTRIHACMPKPVHSELRCREDVKRENILTIIPSVMKWKNKDTRVVGEFDKDKERTFNVCYSMHSSFDELKQFVRYFKALDIHPCVCPDNQKDEILCTLQEIRDDSDTEF